MSSSDHDDGHSHASIEAVQQRSGDDENDSHASHVYHADDELPLFEARGESTLHRNYPFLDRETNLGERTNNRPFTSPGTTKVSEAICDALRDMNIEDQVLKRRHDDDEGPSEEEITQALYDESMEVAEDKYDSEYGIKGAATLHAMDPDAGDINPPTKKRQRVITEIPNAPTSTHFQKLIRCLPPPPHGTGVHEEFVMKTICDVWGVWEFVLNHDPRVSELYNANMGRYDGSELQLRYAIISTSILTDNERSEVLFTPQEIGKYSTIDILSIWFASDECIQRYYGGGGARSCRISMLDMHYYPIGRKGRPDNYIRMGKTEKLRYCYKHPNLILALYLREVIDAFKNNRLRAHRADVGLQVDGCHFVIEIESGNPKQWVSIPCVDSNFMSMIRCAGFANSVVCLYHHVISNDDGEFTIDEVTHRLGIAWMGSPRCNTTHLQCFPREPLTERYDADSCIALRGHLSCSDTAVNSGEHRDCTGGTVTTVNEYPNFLRTLHINCTCGSAAGNFSGDYCRFVSIQPLISGASSFEKIGPNPDGEGSLYNYLPVQPQALRPSGSEDIRNRNETRTRVRELQGLPANDVVVADNDTFNDEPQHPVFPVIGGFTAVLIDFETTSLGASTAHILELALLHMHEEKIHSDYINPGVHFPAYQIEKTAFKTHGISKMMLAGKIGTKDGLERMFDCLNSWRREGTELCLFGHNIGGFDLPLLHAEARRHNLEHRLEGISYVDTYQVLKRRGNNHLWTDNGMARPSSFSLGNLYNHIFERGITNQHSAVGDVLANAEILMELDPNLTVSRDSIRELTFD